jgi:tRNA dimethylallyltransferase
MEQPHPHAAHGPDFPPLVSVAWFVVGPTASGKSSVAHALAERVDAELLSLDSMAVYRGMDIGTAKPTPEQRERYRYHLLDLVEPTEAFSIGRYLTAAHQAVSVIRARGRQPIFVGGTPLYLKALLRGLHSGPPADPQFRQEVERDADEYGVQVLWERLRIVDPLAAHQLKPSDRRRIIRALEVVHVTGKPLSHQQVHFDRSQSPTSSNAFFLKWPREQLHRRIETRVEMMIDAGLFDEVERLLSRYGTLGRTASQAVGYREPIACLQGQGDRRRTLEEIQAHTRQLARRQETWYHSLPELRAIPCIEPLSAERVAEQILAQRVD